MMTCDKFSCEEVIYLRDEVNNLTKRVKRLEETLAWMLVDYQDLEIATQYYSDEYP